MLASELPAWIVRVFAFVFGATWGSFFNVAIYRWPREMSVVTPRSHCPACAAPIPGWRNVPILGYLLLRGKAACCGAKMSPRYLFVEVLSGVLAIAIAERFIVSAEGATSLGAAGLETALWFAFAGGLVIATFVDLEWMEIPDEVSIGGTALALATAMFRPSVPLEEVVLGAGAGYLVVHLLLVWSWERITGDRGMGEGDAKLAMFIGAFLGWRGALFALVAGSFQGIIGYVIARASGSRIGPSQDHPHDEDVAKTVPEAAPPVGTDAEPDAGTDAAPPVGTDAEPGDEPRASRKIPFGPFLALGAIEFLFFGNAIVDWYLSLFE
ncbi:MAG: prepilin peptidase [Myxococcota bacterium]|nr:prepilin peptidase [Myxococcota bacterium]